MESAENREQSPKIERSEEQKDLPSLSKIETIKLLNDSIDKLESTIKAIGDNSAKKLPSPNSIDNLLNTTQELADSVTPSSPTPDIVRETPLEQDKNIPPAEAKPVETKPIPPAEIKSKPPANPPSTKTPVPSNSQTIAKNNKKENRALTIIGSIAVAIAIVAIVWLCLPQIKAAIAPKPETTEIVSENISEPEIQPDSKTVDIPVVDRDLEIDKIPEENSPLDPQLPKDIETEPQITEPTPIPLDLTSPGKAKNLKIATIEPELTFTPEQSLIAVLQSKLAEITDNYDPDLFNNIQVDLPGKRLLIEVTDNWYELNEVSQDKLANEILKRTRRLNFDQLKLQDPTGTLVARNPVVGDRIIILQSSKNN